ncbi:TonB C-terminal domain-containing protein [Bradyrhizobium sp. Ai1a-2]|uniref:TonB C-terminal domain-containing protein n=1 Tax=Bradyrhizobium sp. Ai1a-2 TaxID=196490 RepID=UPI0012687EE8|nr:TonB C-terminal domain-containing protein [Bradyrhizobium sp. Ai1a-2]
MRSVAENINSSGGMGIRQTARSWAWGILVAALSLFDSHHVGRAQSAGATAQIQFDIPPQPLASSLKAFGDLAKVELYYESGIVGGYRSRQVRGMFSADRALQLLLEGTGLSVASFEPGTITILAPSRQDREHELALLKNRSAEFLPYFALIQASLRSVFCQSSLNQTDNDEIIVRLWIAPSGSVRRAELASPTGSQERDRAYIAAVRELVIASAPPPNMPQPVTLLVLPRSSQYASECPQPGGSAPARAASHE